MAEIDRKEKPDLLGVMSLAGVDLSRILGKSQGMCRCPFHNDGGNPNMVVYVGSGYFRCFRCGAQGDSYDFVGLQEYGESWDKYNKTMFMAVCGKIKDKQIPIVKVSTETTKVPPEVQTEIYHVLALASRVYNLALGSPIGIEAQKYLATRMIDMATIRSLRLGFAAPGALAGVMVTYPAKQQDAAAKAGLYYEGREWLQNRIVFPDVTDKGVVKHMVGRSLIPDAKVRYMSLPGINRTLYRLGACSKTKTVIITESMMDTVNLWQMGLQGVGVNGTGMSKEQIADLSAYPHIAILPQNDDAGREGVAKWKLAIPQAFMLDIPYKEGEKDVNDLVRRYGFDATGMMITDAIANAKRSI